MQIAGRDRRGAIVGGAIGLACLCLFVGVAIVSLLSYGGSGLSISPLADPYIRRVLVFTLWQAGLSTALSILFAIPVARALARQRRFPGRVWVLRLMAVPMGLPVLIGALGLLGLWGRQGMLNKALLGLGLDGPVNIYGLSGILLAHVFFNMPLAVRYLVAGLDRVPNEYWLLSAQLGMRSTNIFRFVEWPVMRRHLPGIAGLIFMLCATSFTLVLVLGGGPASTTVEVAIYQALRFDFDPGRAVSLAVIQIIITAMLLSLIAFLPVPEDHGTTTGRTSGRPDARPPMAKLADGAAIAVATAFVLSPLAMVAAAGMRADLLRLLSEPVFWQATATSLTIAFFSGLIAVLLGLAFVRAQLETGGGGPLAARAFSTAIGSASSLVLLVPPVVLGTGWFLVLRSVGVTTLAAPYLVLLINTVMALPFVVRILHPAVEVHRQRTMRLSASLGMSGLSKIWLVDWPLLRRALLMALSFAMALSLGDLGAVALFGSDGFMTLPWLLFSRLGSYRTADADGLALLLGIVCLALTIAGTVGQGGEKERRDG
jgi:thiamine transport system permease protein